MSKFKPEGMKEILESIPKTHLVLGVGYKEGDFQIGISGRRKTGEDLHDTVRREMAEEISITPDILLKCIKSTENNHYYKLNINDTTLYPCHLQRIDVREDTIDRIVICVHGSRINIMKYMNIVRLNKNNNDFITCIWCESVDNILKKYF